MITLFIFYAHTVGAVILFTKRWQESDWKEGLLAVGFLFIIFSVGWSIATFIIKLLVTGKGLAVWLDRDTLSLLLLTAMESLFFYIQMKRKKRKRVIQVS
ncbi:MAG TPA: hypothetical protein VKI62_06890 [Bacteroidota bacterium]|nr:hypothetical protein [Bacteroidota bacterium]